MKISYQRTGGFAGMVLSFDLDTETLTAEKAQEIQKLVETADFLGLPAAISSDSPGADQFQYKLTVEHTIEIGDGAVPENLWPLLNEIRVLSRSNRQS